MPHGEADGSGTGEPESPLLRAAAELGADGPRLAAARTAAEREDAVTAHQRLIDSAVDILQVGSGAVSLMTDQQVVLAGAGLAAAGQTIPFTEALCTLPTSSGEPLVVDDAAGDPRAAGLAGVRAGLVRSYLGVPIADADGRRIGSVCVFNSEPRSWTGSDVAVVTLVAEAVGAQLELDSLAAGHAAELVRQSLAVDSAEVGSFDWDLVTGRLLWDERLHTLFGYTRADFTGNISAFEARLHPDDRDRVGQTLQHVIDTAGDFESEYRIVRPSGETRWVQARGKTVTDAGGRAIRLLGAAYDTTDVRDGQARTQRVLEAMPSGFYSLDDAWRFSFLNAAAERLLGRTRDELVGRVVWESFPDTVGSAFEEVYRDAVTTGRPRSFEAYYPAPLDAWYEVLAWPTPEGLSVYFSDVTQRRRTAAEAERTAARLALSGQVSTRLLDAADLATAVADLPRLLVPLLADGAILTLLDDDGRPTDVGSWHDDPVRRDALARFGATRPEVQPPGSPTVRALAQGCSVQLHPADFAELLPAGPARDALAELAAASAVVLPVPGRERMLGTLTLFSGADRPIEDDAENVARDVVGRVGLALDNARLARGQEQIAEGLQRSLLTAPPEPDHSHVVVRYVPAGEAARVGGDWYDAFLQRDGATVLVIGDVAGHDVAAAAIMGQLRGLLRGIATHSGGGPAEILSGLDSSMELLRVDTLATAVVARLEQTPAEHDRGITRLRWSNAGHPTPLVVHPDGSQLLLAGPRPELLLGVDPGTTRTEQVVVLDGGTTVLLYSDGLVERRDATLDEGVERLQQAVRDLGDVTLDDLCDGLIDRLVHGRPDDDVALVAVRLYPQDRPRPPGAGPTDVPDSVPPDLGQA